jgi:hypothetical protein
MTRYQKKPTEVVGCITKYESCFIGLLRDHLSELNEADANKLRRYAESKGTKIDDASYSEALEAERECRAEIYREQM